jgi:hypothetical protein
VLKLVMLKHIYVLSRHSIKVRGVFYAVRLLYVRQLTSQIWFPDFVPATDATEKLCVNDQVTPYNFVSWFTW